MGDLSLRDRKRRLRGSPLQHTSGNIRMSQAIQYSEYPDEDYNLTKTSTNYPSHTDHFTLGTLDHGRNDEIAEVDDDQCMDDEDVRLENDHFNESKIFNSESYAKYQARENQQKCPVTGLPLWSPDAERLFQQFVLIIPPVFGKVQIACKLKDGSVDKKMGRNQLLAYLLSYHNAPVEYDRKTISSHIQVIVKQLKADGNQEALARMRTSRVLVGKVQKSELWFDEITMCLRTGDINAATNATSASHFLPKIHRKLYEQAVKFSRCIIHEVHFQIGLERWTTEREVKNICTILQTPGGAAGKPIAEMSLFANLYPELPGILSEDDQCELIWFDSIIKPIDAYSGPDSRICTEFLVDILNEKDYENWQFSTSWYHNSGQPVKNGEFHRKPSRVVPLQDSPRVRLELSLFSQLWVDLLLKRITNRREATKELRKQLETLQHGKCSCQHCVQLQGTIQRVLVEQDEGWRKRLHEISITQVLYGQPRGTSGLRRVAVFLFKFTQAREGQTPLTTWQRLLRPHAELPYNYMPRPSQNTIDSTYQHPGINWDHSAATGGQWSIFDNSRYSTSMSSSESSQMPFGQHTTPTDSLFSVPSSNSTWSLSHDLPYSQISSLGYQTNIYSLAQTQLNSAKSNPDLIDVCFSSQQPTENQPRHITFPPLSQNQEMDMYHRRANDVPFDMLNEQDLLAGYDNENMPFNFNAPLTVPLAASAHTQAENLHSASGGYGKDEDSNFYAPQPRRIIPTAHLSSPIVMKGEEVKRLDGIETQSESIQDIEGFQANQVCADADYLAGLGSMDDQNDSDTSQPEIQSASRPQDLVDHAQASAYVIQHQESCTQHSWQNALQLKDTLTDSSNNHEQLSLISSAYQPMTITNSAEEVPSDCENVKVEATYEGQHFYNPHPIPVPSQHFPTPTHSAFQEDESQHQATGTWHLPTTLDAHNWVLDLAIAQTEHMIEQAHTSILDTFASVAVQANSKNGIVNSTEDFDAETNYVPPVLSRHEPHGAILGDLDEIPSAVRSEFMSDGNLLQDQFQHPDHAEASQRYKHETSILNACSIIAPGQINSPEQLRELRHNNTPCSLASMLALEQNCAAENGPLVNRDLTVIYLQQQLEQHVQNHIYRNENNVGPSSPEIHMQDLPVDTTEVYHAHVPEEEEDFVLVKVEEDDEGDGLLGNYDEETRNCVRVGEAHSPAYP